MIQKFARKFAGLGMKRDSETGAQGNDGGGNRQPASSEDQNLF